MLSFVSAPTQKTGHSSLHSGRHTPEPRGFAIPPVPGARSLAARNCVYSFQDRLASSEEGIAVYGTSRSAREAVLLLIPKSSRRERKKND